MKNKEKKFHDAFGFEGLYYISKEGEICNREFRPIKVFISNNRAKVTLTKDGKAKTCYVSRLFAQTFIENPNGHRYVVALDGDHTNLVIENFAWVKSFKDVRKNAIKNGSKFTNHLRSKDVLDILDAIANGSDEQELANKYKVTLSAIRNIKEGKTYKYVKRKEGRKKRKKKDSIVEPGKVMVKY